MAYYLRLMTPEDIAQVSTIDHEAFPTMWPSPNFKNELKNRLAHYIVAAEEGRTIEETAPRAVSERVFSGLVSQVQRILGHEPLAEAEVPVFRREYVVGFAGFWFVASEVHLTNIAVREECRHQGIGELLLISILDQAIELKAHLVTLEVRISNNAALSLYDKFGFTRTGLRRAYYTDNREDAVLMSLENIGSASFQRRLQQLKDAHFGRWGYAYKKLPAKSFVSAQ
jgi:ribosomal-protein-alanine N-acetyltransferase